jgi:uncharacterized protein YcbK (DUF882 family)
METVVQYRHLLFSNIPAKIAMSTYFSPEEFACKCQRAECDAITQPSDTLLIKLNKIRESVGYALIVNSGIRCRWYNERVGGAGDSAHVTGEAADIRVHGSRERFEVVREAARVGITRIGIAKSFVHLDVSATADGEVLWLY